MKKIAVFLSALTVCLPLQVFCANGKGTKEKSLLVQGTEALAKKIVTSFHENVSEKHKNNVAVMKFREAGEEDKKKGHTHEFGTNF